MANLNIGKVVMTFNQNPYISSTTYPFLEAVYDIPTNTTYLSLQTDNVGILPVYPVIVNESWIVLCKGIGVTTDNNYTNAEKTKLTNIEALADVTDTINVGTSINGSTAKVIPVDADTVGLIDSASSNVLSKLSWLNIKASLKTYFDTLYNLYTHPTGDGNHHVPATSTTNSGKILKAGATAGSESWGTLTASDVSAIPTTQKGVASGVASTNANNQVIQDALNALSLGGNLASLYPTISSGTWTPTIYGEVTHGTAVFTIGEHSWVKIGNLVHLQLTFTLSSKGGMTGDFKIGNLPFDATGRSVLKSTGSNGITLSSGEIFSGALAGGGTEMYLIKDSSTGWSTIDSSAISDTAQIQVSGYYITV